MRLRMTGWAQREFDETASFLIMVASSLGGGFRLIVAVPGLTRCAGTCNLDN
jgi:hypothetical protein